MRRLAWATLWERAAVQVVFILAVLFITGLLVGAGLEAALP
jgi:hypothetical protein